MKRDFIHIHDLKVGEIGRLLEHAIALKAEPSLVENKLQGKHIGILFEKHSTRTRVSLEVGIGQMGGRAIFLNWQDIQLSRGEDIPDTARVLSRYLDGLIIRAKSHNVITEMGRFASIPVINALSNLEHPMQTLADLMTIKENGYDLSKVKVAYVGDGNNNVSTSLATAVTMFGGEMTLVTPAEHAPDEEFLKNLQKYSGKVKICHEPFEGVEGVDVIYTDVWVSMGDESEAEQRRKTLAPFQVNRELLQRADSEAIVLHCLPATKGEEITEEVFESPSSKIFDQAENRLHAQKALLTLLYR